MKKKLIVIGSVAAIAITSIGGLVFAQDTNKAVQNQPEARSIVGASNSKSMIYDKLMMEDNNIVPIREEGQPVSSEENDKIDDKFINRHNELHRDRHNHEDMVRLMKEQGLDNMADHSEHHSTHHSQRGRHGRGMGHMGRGHR